MCVFDYMYLYLHMYCVKIIFAFILLAHLIQMKYEWDALACGIHYVHMFIYLVICLPEFSSLKF